jgi:hypothetical protein
MKVGTRPGGVPMRNTPAFAIPLEFNWKVERGGYRWFNQAGKKLLCPAAPFARPDWPDPFGRDCRTYRPLLEHTGLFREFAALPLSETAIRDFADRYGQLGDGKDIPIETRSGERVLREEALEHWKGEITDLRWAVALWDAISTHDQDQLKKLVATLKQPQTPLGVQQRLYLENVDPAMTALAIIRNHCDARLGRVVIPRLLFEGNRPRLRLSLEPQNLLSALWLQFAVAIDGLRRFAGCAQCGAPFEISRALKTGKRTDARFCRVACRVNHYRTRVARAHQLSAAGCSISAIARDLNTPIQTVRNWLRSSKSSPRNR